MHYGLSCLSNWWPINPRMPNMLPTVYVDISFWSLRYDTHFLSIQFNVCLLRNAFLEPISTLGRIFPDWQSNNVLDIRLKAPFWIQIRDVRSINVLIILASTLTFDVLAIRMLFNPRLYFCLDFVVHFALTCLVIVVCLFDNIESWDGEGGRDIPIWVHWWQNYPITPTIKPQENWLSMQTTRERMKQNLLF